MLATERIEQPRPPVLLEHCRIVKLECPNLDLVRDHIPETLLLARERVAWGRTAAVLTDENLARARHLHEAFEDDAELCEMPA